MTFTRLLVVTAAAALAVGALPVTAQAAPVPAPNGSAAAGHETGVQPGQRLAAAVPPGYAVTGIDVSNHQETIDWAAVARSGQRFAYAKATEGTGFRDSYYAANRTGARNNNIYFGAYHYARPDRSSGRVQADFLLDNAQYSNDGRTLPPMLDIEWPWEGSGSPSPCYGLSTQQMVAWIRDFVNRIRERTGQRTMIYTNANWWNPCTGNNTSFGDEPLFVARYNTSPNPLPAGWSTWKLWQFTSSASVPGVSGGVDQNVFNGTVAELAQLAGGTTEQPSRVGGRWGDFDGDGRPDVAGVAGGDLWVHRGAGS
ncbi:GH25 family lysozyme, partial [Actinoplanes sp. NPDC023801]|uniref:GH25 family lysozyme n=1 Tax=Actinoplanes sp. NPDC023801 TaxID=3154595 RepID=UPI0033E95D16